MSDRLGPQVYSIAAHRGFADALVAGLLPRYSEDGLGLARLTLLLPSGRAIRTVSEAFVRRMGEDGGQQGLLLPEQGKLVLRASLEDGVMLLNGSPFPIEALLQSAMTEPAPSGDPSADPAAAP